jgi:nitrate/nitrite transporter NarK
VGGYLTDRLGRRRVLTWSILLYAFSAFAAGLSTNIWMLLFFRCTTFIGVCVEFVAAVAWLAELFPEPKVRERVLGYTQFFSSLGGLMVAYVNHWLVDNAASLPSEWLQSFVAVDAANLPWRYTLMSGLIPAIPLIVIRPFLPESPTWQAKKAAGTLRRPSIGQLFAPDLRRTTVVTTLMFACSYGAAFGAIQQIPQIVPALPEVQARIASQTEGKPEAAARGIQGQIVQGTAAAVTKNQEYGGLMGRLLLAVLVTMIVSRRWLIRVFLLPGLIILPLVFGYAATTNLQWLQVGIFFVGLFTVGQFSFWGNYLPRVYPIHLRGTGESFAANIGGRMIGTSFAMVTSILSIYMPGETDAVKMAAAATFVGTGVYVCNLGLSYFLPEPQHEALPD